MFDGVGLSGQLQAALDVACRYALANMDACVRIGRPGAVDGSVSPSVPVVVREVYSGRGRVHMLSGGAGGDIGDELVWTSVSTVSVPLSVSDVRVDDLVEVVEHRDHAVVGRTWRVTGVSAGGSLAAVRSLTVSAVRDSSTSRWVS